jgi:putative MATE family efflux protein
MEETKSLSQKSTALRKDWTKGPILRNLLQLSWPMVTMETLFVVSQVVDMIWIGRLGSTAIAGVGIANIVVMMVMSMDMGLIVGVRALVARHVGEGDIPGANRIAGQALIMSAGWGALMMIIGYSLAGDIMGLFGMEEQVVNEGMAYMRVMFAGWVAMDLLVMSLYIFQSSGDTITPMLVEASIRVVHITMCPFLVLGLWIFPDMGVRGAALSNVVSQSLGAIILLTLLMQGRSRLKLSIKDFYPVPRTLWRIIKIGLPALLMNVQRSFGNLILTWFIAPFGTLAIAAHSLASRIEMFVTMPPMGIGMGAGVMVGQNLGARQPQRAERSAWLGMGVVEVIMLTFSTALLIWANQIMGVFTRDPELIKIGSLFLRIATASYVIFGISSVLQNCIAGAGDTLPNMIISIATIWLVQIPLALLLPKTGNLGVYGIRWAIVAATFVGAIVYLIYFKRGRWKKKKV